MPIDIYLRCANQKAIKIKKSTCDEQHRYLRVNLGSLKYAMNNLSGEAFKMWVYLVKNANDYEFLLSKADALYNWGIGSESSYSRGIATLKNKGYLVQVEPDKENYIFYDVPPGAKIEN